MKTTKNAENTKTSEGKSGEAGFSEAPCSPHDFPEDYQCENGNYGRKCCRCDAMFTGLKRRMYCKICDAENAKWWESLTNAEKKNHMQSAREVINKILSENVRAVESS